MGLNLENLYRYTQFRGRTTHDLFPGLDGQAAKVTERVGRAATEAKKPTVTVDQIIHVTNTFLHNIGIDEVPHSRVAVQPTQILKRSQNVAIDYSALKNDPRLPLNHETHLI